MKLAFVIFRYFPFGGLQRDMLALAHYAHQQGHCVTVFCERWDGDKLPGIDVVEINARGIVNTAGVKNFVEQFLQQIPRAQFDVLIGFNKMPGLDVYFAGDACFADKAYRERNWLYRLAPRSRLYIQYENAVFGVESNTQILLLVAPEQKTFARFYATAPERFHLLPPGISAEHIACADPVAARLALRAELGLSANTQIILCLGSGFHTKGVDISISAFAELQKNRPDSALMIVGNDNPTNFRRQAASLGISDKVFFPGPRSPVGKLLHATDVLLHPARRELAGNVILEAILAGCPVLASDHCGFAHYVTDNHLGKLIPPAATPAAIARLLESLLVVTKNEWQLNAEQFKRSADVFSRTERALEAIETIVQHKTSALQWQHKTADELVVLRDELIDLWRDQPAFEKAQQLTGKVVREMPDRQTLRFEWNGRAYYRKWHRGVGWKEIVKNLVRLRWPVLGARNEWDALNKMRASSVPGVIPVAYGLRGKNPARQESFIVTRELTDVIQLDHLFEQRHVSPKTKRAIIAKVASIASELHAAGINHRDFYLCHFMLREASLTGEPEIMLVDLHRAQLRIAVPERWLVKDLAGLLFSTLNLGFSRRDYYRFLVNYFTADLRSILRDQRPRLQEILRRARATYQREFGHKANL